MKYIIITGTSRGLGEALAYSLMGKDIHLFCISRNKNKELIETAEQKGYRLNYYDYDLNNLEGIEVLVNNIFNIIKKDKPSSISLINNAGIVTPIKPIDKCTSLEITRSITINLLSPMALVSSIIRNSINYNIEKRIINISSGAGKNPYYGWGCYCTTKAGIDMFTRSVGLEQQNLKHPFKVMSLAPGVLDTDMQVEIRSTNNSDFPQIDKFIGLKERGELLNPKDVANKIKHILFSKEFDNGALIDIRSL